MYLRGEIFHGVKFSLNRGSPNECEGNKVKTAARLSRAPWPFVPAAVNLKRWRTLLVHALTIQPQLFAFLNWQRCLHGLWEPSDVIFGQDLMLWIEGVGPIFTLSAASSSRPQDPPRQSA
ncbi:hypothetical protein DPEC_G00302510 [Dallia pectoralis]|uniref:Uncharacterized protein n=1 Tax=Dallia pectoralis TaxID=75939 RepID=A0ACC2FH34_DALPE|nr:hypothetical protein DPEC_G00302510 [Dallia pectoralis]